MKAYLCLIWFLRPWWPPPRLELSCSLFHPQGPGRCPAVVSQQGLCSRHSQNESVLALILPSFFPEDSEWFFWYSWAPQNNLPALN